MKKIKDNVTIAELRKVTKGLYVVFVEKVGDRSNGTVLIRASNANDACKRVRKIDNDYVVRNGADPLLDNIADADFGFSTVRAALFHSPESREAFIDSVNAMLKGAPKKLGGVRELEWGT